jgi:hypothetical protein
MTKFQRAGLIIAGVISLHAWAVVTYAYYIYVWLDIIMHTLGGLAIGALCLAFWDKYIKTLELKKIKWSGAKFLVELILLLGLVGLVGIAWEWHEFLLDLVLNRYLADHQSSQPDLGDTMADLWFDLVGGTLAWLIFRNRRA